MKYTNDCCGLKDRLIKFGDDKKGDDSKSWSTHVPSALKESISID